MNRLSRFLAQIDRYVQSAVTVSCLFLWRVLWRPAVVVLFLALFAGLVVAVQTVPEWQVQRAIARYTVVNPEARATPVEVANLQNEMRRTFLQVVGGAFALFALYLTFRRVVVAEQGHITDRYTKAIEQLGATKAENKPNVEVRLGAIYALERIDQDSVRDHWPIMEVLTEYVQQNAPAPVGKLAEEDNKMAIKKGPAMEIQAILTVLGRRRRDRRREHIWQRLDLRDCDLRGAKFQLAHMEKTRFDRAHVEGAIFYGAQVEEAIFYAADVKGADFYRANTRRTRFYDAHLEESSFLLADVEGAYFDGAHMEGANFDGAHVEEANFAGAIGLTVEQFKHALGWEQAKFDEAFRRELVAAKEKDGSPG
ncbi:MAG: pentapeptide repeat-containing protein [Terracidiphilus sp.]